VLQRPVTVRGRGGLPEVEHVFDEGLEMFAANRIHHGRHPAVLEEASEAPAGIAVRLHRSVRLVLRSERPEEAGRQVIYTRTRDLRGAFYGATYLLNERCASSGRGISAGQVGDVAQLVEHLLCKQGVGGSSPLVSTEVVQDQRGSRRIRTFCLGGRGKYRDPRDNSLVKVCYPDLAIS
jgi:hypothetical protein